ncbi:MAG TPA: IPExxxVDY family protein [Perlabentimonas sp.]|jgi:hypothetical protein|nr:IPExxxVDY family protein [Bacteroidales bacterium]MDD4671600.1 IPExxxVDY family protein [Bacteroidales bacterium]MDY0347661.1 IPExxxVDY family protein [Tenuifilaceae bacterium]HZJ74136.1 IPExxxVDY family protein [Perlabentimonas sp.]
MKKKQIKLEIPAEQTSFIAIACTLSIHKFVWELNNALDISLSESNEICINENCFPVFKDEMSLANKSIVIIKNRIETGVLIQKLVNIDYILKIRGPFTEEEVKVIMGKIKKITSVIAVIQIDPSKFKGVNLIQNT